MRIAGGIIMMVLGMILLLGLVVVSLYDPLAVISSPVSIFNTIVSIFIIVGGIFCFYRRYWKLCFASALATVSLGIFSLVGYPSSDNWIAWSFALWGILPIIFIYRKRREWQEISA